MKSITILLLGLLIIIAPLVQAHAISEAALLFLLISPSPRANGMGNSYLALPGNDAMAPIYNPAMVGLFSLENNFSLSIYPHSVQWLPGLIDDVLYDSKALAVGFKLNKNISAGIGYHLINMDLGEIARTNEQGNVIELIHSWEKARALSLGIGGYFGVKIGLGMSVKYVESELGLIQPDSADKTAKADIYAYDFGAIVQIPIFEILNTSIKIPFANQLTLKPFFVPSLGYSIFMSG